MNKRLLITVVAIVALIIVALLLIPLILPRRPGPPPSSGSYRQPGMSVIVAQAAPLFPLKQIM